MKTNRIPALTMLSAGLVVLIIAVRYHYETVEALKILLIVLIVFYMIGSVFKNFLDKEFLKETEGDLEETAEIPEENQEQKEEIFTEDKTEEL